MNTAAATAPARTSPTGAIHRGLAGTGGLMRFMLRRDRIKLPAWAGGLGLYVLYVVTAIPTAYGEEDLGNVVQLFQAPVGRMLVGPAYGFDDPSYERLVANGYGLYLLLLAALMSILLVTRHTRQEEQTGRADLVRAAPVGRHAPLTATLLVAVLTNLAAGLAILVAMVAVGGFGVDGSVLFAAGVAGLGLAFAGITAFTTQLTASSRVAAGMAGTLLGVAFVLRAGGDMAREGGSALSWFSPLAWPQQTAPFVLDRWWPLAFPIVLAVVATAGGYAVSTRRDLGASLLAVRRGPSRAAPWLGTPWGLALRLQRATLIGWTVALVISGVVFGVWADAMLDAVDDMPATFVELFGGAEDMLAGYLGYMTVFMAFLVSAFAILAVQGLRGEETDGRADPVLATSVSRWAWLGGHLAVTAGGVVALLAITGAATGVGVAVVTGDATHVGELTLAHLNQVPAVLVVLALAALLYGLLPRAVGAAWAVLGYGVVVGTFGPLLDLPGWLFDLSPFEHPARMPLESFRAAPVLALTVLAAALTASGLPAFHRRDVDAG